MFTKQKNNTKKIAKEFPTELLYAECKTCKSPLFWKKEQTTQVLEVLEIPEENLSFFCMFVSNGCPHCTPENSKYAIELEDTRTTKYHTTSTENKIFWANKI